MSSHHIIREDQEPALIIDDARSENSESIQQLLEWSPTVIVTQRALEPLLLWGTKIDVVVAPVSQLESLKIELQEQLPLKILSYNTETEALDTALYFLTASKQKAVTIISDVALESFEKFTTLDLSVIIAGKRWVFIRNGHFEKWLPAGTQILLYPEGAHPAPVVDKEGLVTVNRDHSFWICEVN
jgi:thiamine pyrophosphokinase